MEPTRKQLDRLVGIAFSPEELAFLADKPEFQAALKVMTTAADIEPICEIGERLLGVEDKALDESTTGPPNKTAHLMGKKCPSFEDS